jgi:hypothetical protein
MCWNESVSLNTFLFSSTVLALIIYNNSYTKYKIQELNNIWVYFFLASFIIIQLIEFFIWRNIHNKFYNNIFSIFASLIIVIQPIISIMILSNIPLRNILLMAYLPLAIIYSIYNFSTKYIHSVVSKNGHLIWNFWGWFTNKHTEIVWLFFLLFSWVYEKKWTGIIFGFTTLILSFINYNSGNTIWSMWCWLINSIMIYFAIYLLIYLPFLEKMVI